MSRFLNLILILMALNAQSETANAVVAPSSAPKAPVPFRPSKDCKVKSDQLGAFMAPVPVPTRIIIDSRFSKSQQKDIQAAAVTWNQIGQKMIGKDFFQMTVGVIPPAIATETSFDCSLHFGGVDFLYFVQVKSGAQWSAMELAGQGSETYSPGVTHRCYHPTTFEFYEQLVQINTTIADYRQFRSFALHELGHTLGLGHSCDGTNFKIPNPTYISCNSVQEHTPYHDAVMYPSLKARDSFTGMPETKLNPTANDLIRLECLYGPK